MGVIAKGILRGCQGLFTPVSLGYPLSVFNKNSTLKGNRTERKNCSTQNSALFQRKKTERKKERGEKELKKNCATIY